ncbi:hypothetical protein BDU57DRAFT_493776 [Ampelomyces quisqualis]|uniref:DUF1365-domain-containing protein n=1 Tax=Ampelomyces quisqualis TaxID=50730 RepID=A0A6A5QPM0_AMPQU|nr:hypothetical protein BDU57DRAFT_493776 [Ampelomyces quisqualis]
MNTATRGRYGLLSFLICCATALSPCFVVDGWRAAPLLGVWAGLAGLRWYHDDREVVTDCLVFGVLSALWNWGTLKKAVLQEWDAKLVWSWVGFALLLATVAHFLGHGRKDADLLLEGVSPWTLRYPKARIFPCTTKHARMFPKRHAFEYSYLQCGFPVVPAGVDADKKGVGSGSDSQLGSWWMCVKAEHYLNRGNGARGFYNKLKTFLREQRVDDGEWSYAYLVTAPRFLGYAFNPVSFWYIYDADHHLNKMILEVNNTFGERRMYLLDGSNVAPVLPQPTTTNASGPDLTVGAKSRFNDIWMKDFHVSPFNSRKGSYVLRAQDPFPHAMFDDPVIDNTITLISSKDHAKLVARLNSTGKALDPAKMGILDTIWFVLNWWWVGLVTFPRIVKEAGRLFFKRKLHVWFRPEVLHTGIGRQPTQAETELCKVFVDYLFVQVNRAQKPLSITLHTAIPDYPVRIIATTQVPGHTQAAKELVIRILSPAFYSRFVHYAFTSEAFDRECVFTDEKNRTLWISRPELLPLLLEKSISSKALPTTKRSYLDELRWAFLRKLRCAPAPPAYAISTPSKAEITTEDVRTLPFSPMDRYVRSVYLHALSGQYRRTVTKLFLAQRLTFGFVEIVGLLDLIARVLLCSICFFQLGVIRAQATKADIYGYTANTFKDRALGAYFKEGTEGHGEWWWLIGSALSVSACHMYGLLKGYN